MRARDISRLTRAARRVHCGLLAVVVMAGTVGAQPRILSPRGQASTQVGGHFDADGVYRDGRWVDIDYGRPILRGRVDPFAGEPYGTRVLGSAPVWRVGADRSTRITSEVDLRFGDDVLPAGEHSVFIELEAGRWTLIFSSYGVKEWYLDPAPNTLWGSFGYTSERDVLRTPMTLQTHSIAADQLVIAFTDMTQAGGNLTVWWDDQLATAAFTVEP